MKPPPFEYVRPTSIDAAVRVLADAGEDAKVLAGGQSLVPMLNFRLARPTVLVDIGAIADLRRLENEGDTLVIGAGVRQRDAELSTIAAATCPLIRQTLRHVAHLQIRTRGTIGGSLAHADPAAELPGVAVALDATLVAHSVRGRRSIGAAEFFFGPYTTCLKEDEILTEVRFPSTVGARTTMLEFARRSGDFALAGVVMAVKVGADRRVEEARITAIAVGGSPTRLCVTEACLIGQEVSDELSSAARDTAAEEVAPYLQAMGRSAAYKRELLGGLVGRALRDLTK